MALIDTYRHQGLRRKLVEGIQKKGIGDKAVLNALLKIPRHFFLDKAFEEIAYQDKAFPIGNDQTISQPYTVAYMTALLNVKKREKILEIGTGSGYQAAILATLGARVYTIERIEALYEKTATLLDKLQLGNIRTYHKDGYKGLPEFAPFDKIIVTAGAPDIPEPLLDQLKIGGTLVIPVGKKGKRQTMIKIVKLDDYQFSKEELDLFRFVPLLKNKI